MPVYEKRGRKGPNGEKVWRILVWVGGKSNEKLFHGKRREADSEEARWRIELEGAAASPQVRREAVDLLTFSRGEYAMHAKAHLRPTTWKVRRFQLAQLCEQHEYVDADGRRVRIALGELKLNAFTIEHIDRYKAARLAEGAQPGTINTELSKYIAVRSFAKELGVPCAFPKVRMLPVVGRGRVKFWTEPQLGLLYEAVERECHDLLPVVVFLVNTGCREGEAVACEKRWINLERRLLCIEPNQFWQPKNGKPREVPISDALLPWLVKALKDEKNTSAYVFTTSKKRRGTKTRWACWPKKQFNRARAGAGRCETCREREPAKDSRCPGCEPSLEGGPHTLRHTFASHFLQGCPDMFLLSQVLGHGHESVTRLYAHLLPTHLEKARNVVSVSPAPAVVERALTMAKTMASSRKKRMGATGIASNPAGFSVGAIGIEPTTTTVSKSVAVQDAPDLGGNRDGGVPRTVPESPGGTPDHGHTMASGGPWEQAASASILAGLKATRWTPRTSAATTPAPSVVATADVAVLDRARRGLDAVRAEDQREELLAVLLEENPEETSR